MKTRDITVIGLSVALISIGSWISIPIGVVSITLQTFFIFLFAFLYDWKRAVAAVGVWILLGGFTLPVFSGMRGGLDVLTGPTGGYILSFIPSVLVTSYYYGKNSKAGLVVAFLTNFFIIYLLGTLQLSFVTGLGFIKSLTVGVLPFIVFDVVKILAAFVIAPSIDKGISQHRR